MDEPARPRVGDLMVRTVEVAPVHETLAAAADRMAAVGADALPVVDGDELLGMITADDIDRHAREQGMDPNTVTVGEVVGPGVVHCFAGQSAAEVAAAMAALGVEHLPVLDAEKKLVGVVARAVLPPPKGPPRAHVSDASGGEAANDPHPGLKVYSDQPKLKD